MWRPGAKLLHPFNPELGIGVVRAVEGRFLEVYFPTVDRELRMAAEGGGLSPLVMPAGARARIESSGEEVRIEAPEGTGYRLADGRLVDDADLWPLDAAETPIDRLARLDPDPLGSFRNRVQGMLLQELREAGGLGSFLGGRIDLFPHQLHTALAAVRADPVRWLLADEVGLGKTIEACLILQALVRTGRAERALVIAPGTLVVQWLGELYRKFHQVFVLLDHERIESVARDYGAEVNPFEAHPFGVIDQQLLGSDRRLLRLAREARLELVVVDEAHGLAGGPFKEELSPLVHEARHALLLTATPLQADRRGFFGLLSLLHPKAFASFEAFERAVQGGEAVVPCTSAVRRSDLGGLPPRVAVPVDLAALDGDADDVGLDPRARWLAEHVRGWLERREKVLVFVRDPGELERLQRFLETATRTHMCVFHERSSVAARDIEVARFRDTTAPVLLCSDACAEGRNFQFCDRMVHYDLPSDPVTLEQRIGRLDRIGRRQPVEIVYFRCAGSQPDVARLYERLDLFTRPSAGLDAALAGVRDAVERARGEGLALDEDGLAAAVEGAHEQSPRDLPRVFYPDAYDASQAEAILARVPPELEDRTREFCLGGAEDLGLTLVEKGGAARYFVELGSRLKVEGLPGVPDAARYLGTFDRREAVRQDEIEFFANGHPLVEGLLLELEDGPRGRAALFETDAPGVNGTGLLCIYRGPLASEFVVVDQKGVLRPEWRDPLLESLGRARSLQLRGELPAEEFASFVRSLAQVAETAVAAREGARLSAAAVFRATPAGADARR